MRLPLILRLIMHILFLVTTLDLTGLAQRKHFTNPTVARDGQWAPLFAVTPSTGGVDVCQPNFAESQPTTGCACLTKSCLCVVVLHYTKPLRKP